MKIKIKKLNPDAVLPNYAHEGDVGMDIFSNENYTLKPGERKTISTGIAIELPHGYASLVWDKSGIASKGITILGGVIDAGYRGEYKILLLNTSDNYYEIKKGNKIAQILVQEVEIVEIEEVKDLSETSRGTGGFGSTGLK